MRSGLSSMGGHPTCEGAVTTLVRVNHRYQLDVGASQRDDSVLSAVPGMAPSRGGLQLQLGPVALCCFFKIGNTDNEMVNAKFHDPIFAWPNGPYTPLVKRFSPLVVIVAVIAVMAALRKTDDSAQQHAWKPVDPS